LKNFRFYTPLTLDFTEMSIERIAKEGILRLSSQFPVVAITGPRQSGKTTLAKMTFPEKKYVTFDDKSIRDLASSNPKDFLLAFPDGAIIDEAQKVPEIFDAVKYFVDNQQPQPGKFILTSSSQFKLHENISDSLAGRVAFLKLLPFSINELKSGGFVTDNAYSIIHKGCYPPLYDTERNFIPEDWFENYIDSYIDLDVREHINPSNISTFRKFLQICALYSGQILSMESISKNLGISAPTTKQWLSILESSYIIHFLESDYNNLGKTLIKSSKMYFVDSGLLCHLLRINTQNDLLLSAHKGAVVETFAVSQMLKNRTNCAKKCNLTYFRDIRGFEVDTIADWQHRFAIEIKSNSDAEKKLSANLRKYLNLCNDSTQGLIFYLGDITCTIDGVTYVSWKDWENYL